MKDRLLLLASAAVLPLALALPAAASVTFTARADHWGSFFGDSVAADRDRTLRPASFTFDAPVVQAGSSNAAQYALLSDGTLWAWGQGTNGELGNGADANSFATPVQVQFPARVKIASIPTDAMPYDGALAVDTMGRAWAWGLNTGGEDCLGAKGGSNVPVEIPSLAVPVTALAGADEHATYVAAGQVVSCGQDTSGVLGDGKRGVNSTIPVPVKGLSGADVTSLTQSQDNAGALLADGTYYDWGANRFGQLGNGTTTASDVPVAVSLPAAVTQVAQGGSAPSNGQVIVMLADGSLYGWGNDAWAQLGDGKTTKQKTSPVQFCSPAGVTYATLASGGGTSYAIDTAGNVWAWGAGGAGQLGDGNTVNQKTPVKVDSGASLISSTANDVVAAGRVKPVPAASEGRRCG